MDLAWPGLMNVRCDQHATWLEGFWKRVRAKCRAAVKARRKEMRAQPDQDDEAMHVASTEEEERGEWERQPLLAQREHLPHAEDEQPLPLADEARGQPLPLAQAERPLCVQDAGPPSVQTETNKT